MKLSSIFTVLPILALSACNSDDDHTSHPTPEPIETRQVTLTVLQKNMQPMTVNQLDYDRGAILCGYDIKVSDARGEYTKHDVCIADGQTDIFDVSGTGEITIDYPEVSNEHIYSEFHLDGSAQIDIYDTSVTVTMTNTEFTYVTLDHSNDIYQASINNFPLFDDEQFAYAYIKNNATLQIDSRLGEISDKVQHEVGIHYQYQLDISEDGNIIIDDKFGQPTPMPIISPVISSSDMVGAEIVAITAQGHTAIQINNEGAKAALNVERDNELEDYSEKVREGINTKFVAPFDIEKGYGMYINIYLGESCSSTDPQTYSYHIDSGEVIKQSNAAIIYPTWHDFVEALGDEEVRLCTEVPTGNFFLRMNPTGSNSHATFNIYQWGKTDD